MRKTQYYATALKAAEAVPVIAKKRAGVEGVQYDIEEYSTPDTYDDPFSTGRDVGASMVCLRQELEDY